MKTDQSVRKGASLFKSKAALVMFAVALVLLAIQRTEAAANVVIWDTGVSLTDAVNIESRADWKAVPSTLFSTEANPAKASSDPGYYGREYAFKGDAAIENKSLVAVFRSTKGQVEIYSKSSASRPDGTVVSDAQIGRKVVEVVPIPRTAQPASISQVEILRNAGDEAALQVSFSAKGGTDASVMFVFDKTQIVEIKPAGTQGVSLQSPMEYGVVPGFIGDDLIYAAAEYPSTDSVCIPAEHVFVGLLEGENAEIVTTWPDAKKPVRLKLGNGSQGRRLIQSIEFDNPEQSIYVAALTAPGLWHKETLTPSYLEKDVKLGWHRPFPARWKTQLDEGDAKTTYAFKESRGEIWRGVAGSYEYPVWFDGDDAMYHLGKKVPPKGDSLIYFLEGQNTPLSVLTPVDIMKATLGRTMCDPILDVAGRKLRTHHRRGADGVHRACTCGCTEAIQSVFEKGEEVAKKDYIEGALDDMIFFVQCHMERIEEYRRFADELIKFTQAQEHSSPELKPYLEGVEQLAQQIPQEYSVQKENMKSLEYMHKLTQETLALTGSKSPNNLAAYMELLKAWRGMGGAQDYVVARCHMIARKLFQEAGYGCAEQQKAVQLAMEIRSRCKQVLRNPDGYEIWADY